MSYTTTPSFVCHSDGWDDHTRSHPALNWMEQYTKTAVDKLAFSIPYSEYHTDDFTLEKSTGETITGGKAAWEGVASVYAPCQAVLHHPTYVACTETDYGWEMIGQASVFSKLHGEPSAGEKGVKGPDGKQYDVVTPGAFRFEYVKQKDGQIKLRKTVINADSVPSMMIMMKRGAIKPADLGM